MHGVLSPGPPQKHRVGPDAARIPCPWLWTGRGLDDARRIACPRGIPQKGPEQTDGRLSTLAFLYFCGASHSSSLGDRRRPELSRASALGKQRRGPASVPFFLFCARPGRWGGERKGQGTWAACAGQPPLVRAARGARDERRSRPGQAASCSPLGVQVRSITYDVLPFQSPLASAGIGKSDGAARP